MLDELQWPSELLWGGQSGKRTKSAYAVRLYYTDRERRANNGAERVHN